MVWLHRQFFFSLYQRPGSGPGSGPRFRWEQYLSHVNTSLELLLPTSLISCIFFWLANAEGEESWTTNQGLYLSISIMSIPCLSPHTPQGLAPNTRYVEYENQFIFLAASKHDWLHSSTSCLWQAGQWQCSTDRSWKHFQVRVHQTPEEIQQLEWPGEDSSRSASLPSILSGSAGNNMRSIRWWDKVELLTFSLVTVCKHYIRCLFLLPPSGQKSWRTLEVKEKSFPFCPQQCSDVTKWCVSRQTWFGDRWVLYCSCNLVHLIATIWISALQGFVNWDLVAKSISLPESITNEGCVSDNSIIIRCLSVDSALLRLQLTQIKEKQSA